MTDVLSPAAHQPSSGSDLARRLARYRAAQTDPGRTGDPLPHLRVGAAELAERLTSVLGGEIVRSGAGRFVRLDGPATDLPIDRDRLATLPGHPPPGAPLVCIDTETTGLATAAGTVAFLIGLGWWDGPTFRQAQLLLPDQGEEIALLDELARHIPRDAWLVSYNGRGFDWPLLVTRYRMARRAAPLHDGHLDLLPIVRRVFRHRMDDARLRTVEQTLLGVERHDDVDGWEIPGRYLGFLRGGPAHPLAAVVRHNDEDVRSLARLVALLDTGYADPGGRLAAPPGDLAGLARAYVRAHRLDDALACLDEAMGRARDPDARGHEPWWSPRVRPDFGGSPRAERTRASGGWDRRLAAATPWDRGRMAVDRAHLLRRVGRHRDAADAWAALAAGPGRSAVVAAIELAKLHEHRLGRPDLALQAALHGYGLADRRRRLGMPEPPLEADLRARIARLRRRTGSARIG